MTASIVIERIVVHPDTFVDAGYYFVSFHAGAEYRVYETGIEIRRGDETDFYPTGINYYRQLGATA